MCACARGVCLLPLVDALGADGVDAVDLGDVEDGLVPRGVGGQLHEDLVQEDGLLGQGPRG